MIRIRNVAPVFVPVIFLEIFPVFVERSLSCALFALRQQCEIVVFLHFPAEIRVHDISHHHAQGSAVHQQVMYVEEQVASLPSAEHVHLAQTGVQDSVERNYQDISQRVLRLRSDIPHLHFRQQSFHIFQLQVVVVVKHECYRQCRMVLQRLVNRVAQPLRVHLGPEPCQDMHVAPHRGSRPEQLEVDHLHLQR